MAGGDMVVKDGTQHGKSAPPSWLSRRLVLWLWGLVRLGEQRPLEAEDLPELEEQLRTSYLSARASELWRDELRRGDEGASLARVLWRILRVRLLGAFAVSVLHGVLAAVVRPLMLRQVISTVEDLNLLDILFLGAILILEGLCQLWMKQLAGDEASLTIMSACTALISQRIPFVREDDETPGPKAGKGKAGAITETQLVGNDLVRSLENMLKLFHLASAVVQITCGIIVLLALIGSPALIGIALAFSIVLVSNRLAKLNKRYDQMGLEASDRRLGLLRQILDGIRFIKVSAWEDSYLEKQIIQRAEESAYNRKYRTLEMANATLGRTTPPLASMVTFVTMALLGQPMEPADIFSAVSIFMTLRLPLGVLPESFVLIQSLMISVRRISASLRRPNVEKLPAPLDPTVAASLLSVDFTWAAQGPPALQGVTASFVWGQPAAVIGAVASGKTTLLLGLLGELKASCGTVARCHDRLAYVPQRPVVFSGSVLSNILMGQPLMQSRLSAALKAAQFTRDLELMQDGLETEIGERGTTLSGGQQTRLNIARAFYHDPAVIIADDPLAAVDVHVGSAIFEAFLEWQRGAKLASIDPPANGCHRRSLIMAMNQLQWLDAFDQVVYLDEGRVSAQGIPSEVRSAAGSNQRLADLLCSAKTAVTCDDVVLSCDDVGLAVDGVVAADQGAALSTPTGAGSTAKRRPQPTSSMSGFILQAFCLGHCFRVGGSSHPVASLGAKAVDGVEKEDDFVAKLEAGGKASAAPPQRLTKEEHRQRGSLKNAVLVQYIKAVGKIWGPAYMGCILGAYGLLAANDIYLASWISSSGASSTQDRSGAFVYGLLAIGHAIMMVLCNVASGFAGASAAKNLHRLCLAHTLRAPMKYFDETPSGRIVSRFSADMSTVDLRLPTMMDHAIQMACVTLVLMGTISLVLPWMLVFLVLVAPLYYRLDLLVNRSSREAKRITNNALSPVLTLLQEAQASRMMLRVMEKETWLHDQTVESVNAYARAYYTNMSLMTFLRLQGNALGVSMTMLFTGLIWAVPQLAKTVPGGPTMIGLALTYSIVVPYMLSFLSLFTSFTRVFLASLERLLEQKSDERVPQERPWRLPGDPLPAAWPSGGRLEFCGATLRYQPHLPPAVDGLTLTVPAGTWLGVVGRTGAGKSSLSVLLLRLVELSGGSVLLDGVDVAGVGVHTLRQAVVVVPQDPFLFQGTLKDNLDPFAVHADPALLEALRKVGLDLPLDTMVGKGGGQLSSGQRQLVAMARATLSKARVVIMDEPTASCDARTDAMLQEVTRASFAGRTVLTIAHRLNTILSYDTVLVMEAGRAVEHGPPGKLAADATTRFAQMLSAATGSGAEGFGK